MTRRPFSYLIILTMTQIEEAVQNLKDIVKRRKRLIISIPIITLILGVVASQVLPSKYHSSISILVQKEETLNPLILHEMAVNMASENRLKSFNEIIYSRSTIEMLIDTLDLDQDIKTNTEKQELIKKVKGNINTTFSGSDSFEIFYYDSDPKRAKEGVGILANHFIKTRLRHENQRNEQTVEFFQEKLADLEKEVQKRRENILDLSKRRLQESPNDKTALRIQMQNLDREIDAVEDEISELKRIQKNLNELDLKEFSSSDIDNLHTISLMDLPYSEELKSKLKEYDNQKQLYTMEHPSMKRLTREIGELAMRMPSAVNTELEIKTTKKRDLQNQRDYILSNIQETMVANRIDEGTESDYGIYRKLHDEMKVKLEQAKTTRDLGKRASEQFIVIDPPYFPEEPSSPNRPLIIVGSFFIGLFLASFAVVIAEIFDSTIRIEDDLIEYEKPVIAFITDGKSYS